MDLPATPSFTLAGKRALVTGGSLGIGLGVSAALAQAGAHVVIAARRPAQIEDAVAAIAAVGGFAEGLVLDVADTAAACRAIGALEPVDILVNNAGTNRPKPFTQVTGADYDAVLGLNLKAAFFLTQAVSQRMIDLAIAGSIINMSSQMGHVAARDRTIYCASKWGLEGLTRAIALEVAPHRIRVNTVCPTFIDTPMTKPMLEDARFRQEVLSKIKLGRIGRVEDVTGAVLYLASDASALTTGSSIMVDGGWTIE